MTEWSKEQLEEMFGDDVAEQLAFLAGCYKHRLSNDPVIPDGWIVSDEVLRKFAELIVRECILTIQMGISRDGHNTEKFQRSMKHIKQVKEHFGVEL